MTNDHTNGADVAAQPPPTLEQNIERLTERVDALLQSVDGRFDEVAEAFVEQRKYTEFAFGKLRTDMLTGHTQIRADISRLERTLDRVLDTHQRTKATRRRR